MQQQHIIIHGHGLTMNDVTKLKSGMTLNNHIGPILTFGAEDSKRSPRRRDHTEFNVITVCLNKEIVVSIIKNDPENCVKGHILMSKKMKSRYD